MNRSVHGLAFYLVVSPLLLRTDFRCVESVNISVEVDICGIFSTIWRLQYTDLLTSLDSTCIHGKVSTHKNVLLCIRVTLQMYWVDSTSVYEVARCVKYSQIHPVQVTFSPLRKWLVTGWTIYSWKVFH